MKPVIVAFALTVALVAPCHVFAQETPKAAEPTKEHKWLQQFVGEWETESEMSAGPGQPALKCKGTLRARKLGEIWVVVDINVAMPGSPVAGLQTLGYDAKSKKYIGTWVDSVMDHIWKYEGKVDGNTLVVEADGPNMMAPGKTSKYRDSYEFKSKDEIMMSSSMMGDDGKWVTFGTATARRTK